MQEEWKRLIYDDVDYGDKYLVSNLGRIKNVKTGYVRNLSVYGKSKYYQFTFKVDGKIKTFKVHRAVAFAFIPNPYNLPEVNHKDGNKINNNVENLEWVTTKENQIHAVINNLSKSGELAEKTKLTQEQVDYIKTNCIPGDKDFGCAALGRIFNISPTTVSKIIHNHSWKTYTNDYKQVFHVVDINRKILVEKTCLCCGISFTTINTNQKFCSLKCSKENEKNKSKIPKREFLESLIYEKSFVQIGKMFKVSDNTIRNWCKLYDLPYRRKDIVLYRQNMFDIKHVS